MSDPQRLAALPGRAPPKRLGKLPIVVGAGAVVVLGLIPLADVLRLLISQQQVSGASRPDAISGNPGDALSEGAGYALPEEGPPIIPASFPVPTSEPTRAAAEAPAKTQTNFPERQPDVHEQARLQAWQTYYQQLSQLQEDRRRTRIDAMRADMTQQAAQAQQGQQNPQGQPAPGAPPGADGLAPGAQRPGTLYQGPQGPAGLYLASLPVPAMSPYELKAGASIIPYRLSQNIETGAAGQFIAKVTKNVTAYGDPNHILVPQGAYVRGVYEDQTTANDERMRVAVTSILYPATGNPACPGGEELPLGSMPAADGSGKAGFKDQVHRHNGRRFFNAMIRALGGTGASAAGMVGGGPESVLASQMSMQGTTAITQGMRDPGPTFETRAGYPGSLQLTKSIAFAGPWVPGRGFCGDEPGATVQ